MKVRDAWTRYSHVHVWWIIFILVSIVIFLLSFRTKDQNELKDIINTSLALASLLLALVAIVQALLAGNEMTGIVTSIRESIAEIKGPAANILRAAEVLSQKTEVISISTTEISKKLDKINEARILPEGENPDELFYNVDYITAGGLVALYICERSLALNKSFKVDDILDKKELPAGKYISGYATGYVSCLKTTGGAKITSSNDLYQTTSLERFASAASNVHGAFKDNFQIYRIAVDEYFENRAETQ